MLRNRYDLVLAVAALLAAATAPSSPLRAADMLPSGPPPLLYETPQPLVRDVFQGWWLGGTLGGGTANFDFSRSNADIEASGVLGGITGGWNWQNGPIVLGFEGDALATGMSGSQHFNGGANIAEPNINAMLNLRARAGVTVAPQVLLFVTAGGAWADIDLPVRGPGGGSNDGSFFGWSVGGGAEVAFNPNWSARFDYQFTDLNADTVTYNGGDVKYDPDVSTYRGSLLYHF